MFKRDSKKQKLIRAPSDLVSKLILEARTQGKTLYGYVTEIFEQAVRASEMNRSLKEVLDTLEVLDVPRKAGAVYLPRDILDYFVQKTYGENGEELQRLWFQAGKWYGIYLRLKFKQPFEAFVKLLQEGEWDFKEVTLNCNDENFELKCVSAFLSQERTILLQNFVEAAVCSLGYKLLEKNCFRGIIRLTFSRLNPP